MSDRIGTEVAGFRIESLIAHGGMGEVYLATQTFPERRVALKVLPHDLSSDPAFRHRFIRESNAAATLEHPNIVPVHAAGEAEGELYIAMRYVEGEDLRSLLDRLGALTPERAVSICAQVADALEEAHANGVVHRDVKPGNILISKGDRIYLTDFGLIRRSKLDSDLTRTGQFIGTIDYVAPEQIRGEKVDPRADVYSLGCVLYECLVGVPPFRRESEAATLWAHIQEPAPKPSATNSSVPTELNDLVVKAMAKRRESRYATARELRAALLRGIGPTEVDWKHRAIRGTRLIARAALGVLAVVGIVLAVIAFSLRESNDRLGLPLNSAIAIDPETLSIASTTTDLPIGNCNTPQLGAGSGAIWWLTSRSLGSIDEETRRPGSPIPVNAGCSANSLAVAFRTVWVATAVGLLPIDPATGRRLRPIALPGPQMIPGGGKVLFFTNGIAAGGKAIWATSDSGRLVKVDPVTRRTKIVSLDAATDDVVWGEGAAWVLDQSDRLVVKIDPATTTVEGQISFTSHVDAIAVGEGSGWALDSTAGTVTPFNPRTMETRAPIRVGTHPVDIAVGLGAVWIANENDESVSRIDVRTHQSTTIEVSQPVVSVIVDGYTRTVWAAVAEQPVGS
jgi:serine/threonine protein kinase